MKTNLQIMTFRAQELAKWVDDHLSKSDYYGVIGLPGSRMPVGGRINITFGTDDDRALFLMRWYGEFEEVSAVDWRDHAKRTPKVTLGSIVTLNGGWQ